MLLPTWPLPYFHILWAFLKINAKLGRVETAVTNITARKRASCAPDSRRLGPSPEECGFHWKTRNRHQHERTNRIWSVHCLNACRIGRGLLRCRSFSGNFWGRIEFASADYICIFFSYLKFRGRDSPVLTAQHRHCTEPYRGRNFTLAALKSILKSNNRHILCINEQQRATLTRAKRPAMRHLNSTSAPVRAVKFLWIQR